MDKSKPEKGENYRFRNRVKNGNALITTEDLVAQIALVKQQSNSIDFLFIHVKSPEMVSVAFKCSLM